MWPLFVVVVAPGRDFSPGVEEILKPALLRALLAQPSMEALHVRVLRGLAGLDMHHIDLAIDAPSQKMTTG